MSLTILLTFPAPPSNEANSSSSSQPPITNSLTSSYPYSLCSPIDNYNYVFNLFNQCYDVACMADNPRLDIRILPDHHPKAPHTYVAIPFTTRQEVLLDPTLQAVFSHHSSYNALEYAQRSAAGATPLVYHPLDLVVTRQCRKDVTYFEAKTKEAKEDHLDNSNGEDLQCHPKVLLGGTFDHFHNGHRKLLLAAASICTDTLVVGITHPSMLTKKSDADRIDSLTTRRKAVMSYLQRLAPTLTVQVVTITDAFGPAITMSDLTAIVVSTETTAGALAINTIRETRHLVACEIYVLRRTEASTLSSSHLRDVERMAEAKAKPWAFWSR